MGKISKVLVCGHAGVGKTAAIEHLIYGTHSVGSQMYPTIEDIYSAMIETDRGVKEKVIIYDTGSLVHIAVIGNKTDLQEGREVDKEKAAAWAQREKGKTGMLAWKCLGV
uniref:NF-kappa-B inhibitor-interacting Ras-like protein 2 n=1 Tax=Magallana gigas TaxID=29159 RepID=K1QQN3_MAGGI